MIEFSLTGRMTLYNAQKLDNYRFSQYCCNYYIPLRPGKICRIKGIDKVNRMTEVLQNKQFKFEGDVISSTNSLDRVAFRLHVMSGSREGFANTLCDISNTIEILDENNNDMQMQRLEYKDVMEIIDNAWPEGIAGSV